MPSIKTYNNLVFYANIKNMINTDLFNRFAKLGVNVPSVLLPNKNIDLTRWATVACDQYTSQPDYWQKVEKLVGTSPSTLRLTYPEIFLEEPDKEERIAKINEAMKKYLSENIFSQEPPGFVYVERTVGGKTRKGLILALDLEKYDYNKGSQALIRATEGTVLSRIPPRVQIRQNAPIELPHIMVLIDDPDKQIIEPLSEKTGELKKFYDFELMMDGGHVRGFKVDDENLLTQILTGFEKLVNPQVFKSKYGLSTEQAVLLFAMGDGNHSLATAKTCWENLKTTLSEEEKQNHPARFALVEIVNIYDDGLVFEAIHRVVFGTKIEDLFNKMVEFFKQSGTVCEISENSAASLSTPNLQVIPFIGSQKRGTITITNPKFNLAVGSLQAFLDEYLKQNSEIKIDYVHGDKIVEDLSSEAGNIGFFLPAMNKMDFFKTVVLEDALPRKTFSMGEANEKRYYLEARKIV